MDAKRNVMEEKQSTEGYLPTTVIIFCLPNPLPSSPLESPPPELSIHTFKSLEQAFDRPLQSKIHPEVRGKTTPAQQKLR